MNPTTPSSSVPADERMSRVRYQVLTHLFLLTFILYLDRVCMGQAAPAIQREMKLTNTQLGYIHVSFMLAYGLFMAAAGRYSDRFGSRSVLIVIVIWWSFFTGLTGLCTGLVMLLVVRFIFGMGEAGALPNCARILQRWFPAETRGFAQGLMNTAMLVGGALAPLLVGYLMELLDKRLAPFFLKEFGVVPSGWRWTFIIFGVLGIVWAIIFWFSFRDDPDRDPRVNAAELAFIRQGRAPTQEGPQPAVPWRIVLLSRNVWLMGLIVNCSAWCSYFYMQWFPKYLQDGRGVGTVQSGELSSLVLAGGAAGSFLGGMLSDYTMRRSGRSKRTRSIIGVLSMGLSAITLYGSLHFESPVWCSIGISIAFLFMMTMIASWWGVVSDISGPHTATLFGLMNSLGVIGALASLYFAGKLADYKGAQGLRGRDQWDPGLYYMVGALIIGTVAWMFVNSNKSAVEPLAA
jgi:sugar phosphate permease